MYYFFDTTSTDRVLWGKGVHCEVRTDSLEGRHIQSEFHTPTNALLYTGLFISP